MDYYTILAQRARLAESIVGNRIDTVRLHETHRVFIGFREGAALKFAAIPGMPCCHAVEKRYIPVRHARDWHLARFEGRAVDAVDIVPGDRVLHIRMEDGVRLVFEMTGRNANIIVLNDAGTILGSTRVISASMSGFRAIRPGVVYVPPPAREFPDPVWTAAPLLERRLRRHEGTAADALADTVCAGSRLFASEASARAGIDPETPVPDVGDEDLGRLLAETAALASLAEKGGEGGTVVRGGDGLPRDVFPARMVSLPDGEWHDDLDEAVARYARERETGLEEKGLRRTVTAALDREERSIRSTIVKVRRDTGDDDEAERLERLGNTVLANPHAVRKGMTGVVLSDPYGGGEVEVRLDPTLDGPGNAERFFTRSRKLKAAHGHAEERLRDLAARLDRVENERRRLDAVDGIRDLRAMAGRYARTGGGGTGDADRPFPRRFTSVSGLEIIVGRSDEENDALVRWARRNDMWLHAQNIGGSHVILRSPGRQNPDQRSVMQAAAIAAHYSKGRTSAVVPVVCTQVRYVVKRKGQGPGKVTYTREKVLFVEPGLPGGGEG